MPRKQEQSPSDHRTEFPVGDDDALVKAINVALNEVVRRRNRVNAEDEMVEYFLLGARAFDINFETGRVDRVSYTDEHGDPAFCTNITLGKCQTEIARLSGQDLSPSVSQRGDTLDGLRKASFLQTTLEAKLPRDLMETAWLATRRGIVTKSLVGLGMRLVKDLNGNESPEPDIIPGNELGGVPADLPIDLCSAVLRDRTVTLAWLKRQEGLSVPAGDDGIRRMGGRRVRYGAQAEDAKRNAAGGWSTLFGGEPDGGGTDDDSVHVDIVEMFERGPRGTIARRSTIAGEVVLLDLPYDRKWCEANQAQYPPPFPVWAATDSAAAPGFHGKSFAATLVPVEKQAEDVYYAAGRIVKEFDQFSPVLLPTTSGISGEDELRDPGNRAPKVAYYEQNPMAQPAPITQLQVANAGTMPASIAPLFTNLLDRQAGQSELLQGQGPSRVGAPGLQMLYRASNVSLDAPARALAIMWTAFYRSCAYWLKLRMRRGEAVALVEADDAVVGMEIDPATLTVTLGKINSLPWLHEVDIGVKSGGDVEDKAAELQLAVSFLNAKLISPVEFFIWVFRKRLPVDGPKRPIQNAVTASMLLHKVLFNDGVVPAPRGTLPWNEQDHLETYLLMLADFMSKPQFKYASEEVKVAFQAYKEELKLASGTQTPQQLPNPEDAAMMEEMQRRQMMQQMQGMGQGQGG